MSWTDLDTWIVVTGALIAMACALPGIFLLLNRDSMLGDGISHAVLPGLALGFLLTGTRDLWPLLVGAVVAGVVTALVTQALQRFGQVESGAALGVVFCTLFAIGLILIRVAADQVDLDPDCVLYGSLETAVLDTGLVPRVTWVALGLLTANLTLTVVFFKELRLVAFDAAFALANGFRPGWVKLGLTVVASMTTVLAFESVGSILVIAMLVVPAVTANQLTDRLDRLVVLALGVAALSAVGGHLGALLLPRLLGSLVGVPELGSTSSAAMMAVTAGASFVAAWGVGSWRRRRARLAL